MDAKTVFFVLFGLVYFLESIGGSYMKTAVVFIERQFQIPSGLSGLMVSASDFAYIPMVFFTSYFGGKGNRARWIGGGCVIIAVANGLIASSNFLFPMEALNFTETVELRLSAASDLISENASGIVRGSLVEIPDGVPTERTEGVSDLEEYANYCVLNHTKETDFCLKFAEALREANPVTLNRTRQFTRLITYPFAFCNRTANVLREDANDLKCERTGDAHGPFIMIFTGLLILGVGRTVPFSLGLPLVDDNVRKRNLPLYFAGMFFMRLAGPVAGLLVGAELNKIYTTFNPPEGLQPRDPTWIGCWWLGFIIFGVILFFPSLVFFGAAGWLAKATETETAKGGRSLALVDRHIEKDAVGKAVMPDTARKQVIDILQTVGILLRTPVYMGSMIGRVIDMLAIKGFVIFSAKYLQIQFGVPQHTIQKFSAASTALGFLVGTVSGSLAMRYWKIEGRRAALLIIITSFLVAVFSITNAFVGCHSVLTRLGAEIDGPASFATTCNANCGCTNGSSPLYPVCNRDGQAFYSPCHAGCPTFRTFSTRSEGDDKTTTPIFENCACANSTDGAVSRDFCDESHCKDMFYVYFIMIIFKGIVGGFGLMPSLLLVLRSVPAEHRSVSLGFKGFVISLFATLPSPVLWGAIIDGTCLLWSSSCEGKTGDCQIYDADTLRLKIHLVFAAFRFISLFTDVYVWYYAKGIKLMEEIDEKGESNEKKEKPIDAESTKTNDTRL